MYDPEAYVGIDEIAAAITASDHWRIDVNETRPRPPQGRSAPTTSTTSYCAPSDWTTARSRLTDRRKE
jgi:hypothetical protein